MEEERVLETTTVTAGERPQVEGRRRTLCNDHAPPSRKGLQERMGAPQEQKQVRRQPGNEESGWPIRDNMDMVGGTLEWSTGGKKEGCLAPRDGMQNTATTTSSKRSKNFKIHK